MECSSKPTQTPDPAATLRSIHTLSAQIVALKSRRDRGDFKSISDAIELQRALRQREKLQGLLPELRVIDNTVHIGH